MEKQLSYVLILSLKEIALRRIAVAFYNEPSILASIAKFQFKKYHVWNGWQETAECIVMDKWRISVGFKLTDRMSKLRLPESLKKQMIPILKAVGSEITKWKLFHEAYLSDEDFDVHVLEKLCWTTAGTVDYRKTAEQLVRCDVVDIVKRFELTCLYCLQNYIPVLWKELSEDNKRAFCKWQVETPHLQLFFPYILKKQSKLGDLPLTFYPLNSFEFSALLGHKTLAEYCFWKLTKAEREASLVRTAKNVIKYRNERDLLKFEARMEKLSEVLSYLLSLMNREEQIQIFKELPCEVLSCFLDWPWQDLFLDIADVIWSFLPEIKYCDLLLKIRESIDNSGYYFPNFFHNLFLRSPTEFKKRFVDEEIRKGYFFWEFFINEDTETIKVIFRNVDAADRVRLVSSERGLNLIYKQLHNWHVKEVFLREATLSKEDKGRLKEAFMELLSRRGQIKGTREEHRRFFRFVEETDAGAQSNRSSEDETLTRVKYLCCEKGQNSTE